jgi:general secretion pathway protein K
MKFRKKDPYRSERGIALVITLILVTILVTLVVELTYSTQINVRVAATYKDDLRAYYVARAGIELAMALLKMDSEEDQEQIRQGKRTGQQDNLGELWADLSEVTASAQLLEPELFGGGRLVLRITDEDRKINANLINQDPTARIAERLLVDGEIDPDFQSAIADWIDEDQEETDPGGVETRYYESLEVPYACKDGPMDTISELRMIKGSKEALKKTFASFEGEGKTDGKGKWTLEDLFSAVPDRGPNINVNTAPGPVIMALHEDIDRLQVEETLQDRTMDPFPTVQAFRDYFNNNFGISDLPPNLIVASEYFTIESVGIMGDVEKKLRVTVHRDPSGGTLDIISWRVE